MILVAGVSGSVASGAVWTHVQQVRNARSFANTVSTVDAAVGSAIRRDLDFEATLQSMVAGFPQLSNRQLDPLFENLGVVRRYPGTVGFGFIEPVSASELPAFIATMEADPIANTGAGPFAVSPPGVRSQYCLARLGFLVPSFSVPEGLDMCALGLGSSSSGATLASITDTARPAAFGFSPTSVTTGRAGPQVSGAATGTRLLVVVMPVYRGGATPPTTASRRSASMGWVVGTFSAQELVDAAVKGTTGVAVGVYDGRPGGGALLGATGAARSDFLTASKTLSTEPPFRVSVSDPAGTEAFHQGLFLGAIGSVLFAVLFFFLMHLARSRDMALSLVEERTRQLRHQALHDPLTGLPNRSLLFDRAQRMLVRAARQPLTVGAIFVDLDNFKEVNDRFGHQAGDRLLRSVGARLASTVRASDTVGRLGGDEFLVLVESESAGAGPEMVAERLRAVLSEPFELDGPEPTCLAVRASLGVAVGHRGSADELIRDADVALYEAKAAGKDRYVVFQPEMQTAVQDRLALEMDLLHALESDELFLLYQPIFDLDSMRVKGAEALVRWRHPTRGLLQPASFIPLAEESGLVVPIGRWVLDRACDQAAAWHRSGWEIGVSVNVSALQLGRVEFVGEVRQVLDRHGFDPALLTLEITETSLMRDTDLTLQTLEELKSVGVRLSIDDFGTGYSSLAYLRQFPIDSLKIDRTFITRSADTAESRALVHTLVQLGHTLGIETIAEGIEEQGQLDRLRREGCDSGQGFLLARPLIPDDVVVLFVEGRQPASAAAGWSG